MSSNPTWFLRSVVWNLVLSSFYTLFVVRVCLIDVSLHHLVLLIDNRSSWKCHALVAFLSRLSNTLESRVLIGDSNVRLQRIHRLWSSHNILSVSHLVLSSVKLCPFRNMRLLLFWVDLEAVWVLEGLTWWATWHGGTCPISWNFSLRLIVKNKLLRVFMRLSIVLTDYLTIHSSVLLKLNRLNVSSWLRMTLWTNSVTTT